MKPGDVGLQPIQPAIPGEPAGDPQLADRQPGRHDRGGDVTDGEVGRLEDRPGQLRPTVSQGQPDERAAGRRVPDRRPLAGQVGQEDEPVGGRADRQRLGDQPRGRRRRRGPGPTREASRGPCRWRSSRRRGTSARGSGPPPRRPPGPRPDGPCRRRSRRSSHRCRWRRRARAAPRRGSWRARRPSPPRPGSRRAARARPPARRGAGRGPSPIGPGAASRSTRSPVVAARSRSGWTRPGRSVSAATPDRRRAIHSQLARYQRAPPATAGSCRSAQRALGRMPRTQPLSPVASARAVSSSPARVSSQVSAGSDRSTRRVGRHEGRTLPVGADPLDDHRSGRRAGARRSSSGWRPTSPPGPAPRHPTRRRSRSGRRPGRGR